MKRRFSINHIVIFGALLAIPAVEIYMWKTTGCIAGTFRSQVKSAFCGPHGIWILGISLWAFALFPGFYIFWDRDYDRLQKSERRLMQLILLVTSYFIAAFTWLLVG